MKKLSYFVAVLLVFSSFVAIGIGKDAGEVDNANIFDHRDAETMPFEVIKLGEGKKTTGLAGNVLVTIDSEEDDQWPAITQDPNNIVVTWTHKASILECNIGFGHSQNSGGSFTAILVALDDVAMPQFSDIAYIHGVDFEGGGDFVGLYGVFGGVMSEVYGFYRMTDITDDTTYEFGSWTTEAPDISDTCVSDHTWYYENANALTGPTCMYITYSDLCSLEDCPQHIFHDMEGGSGTFFHDCQQDLDTAPARDCDMACLHDADPAQTLDDFVVLTWQYDDPEEGSKIVFKRIEPNTEPDIEYTPYEGYIGPGEHPNIGASEDKVVVTYMKDGNIVAASSTDRGDNFAENTIGPGKFPAVYMSGSDASCAFVNEGNLYLVKSEDGGATWGTPGRINDVDGTVVEEENAVDIHSSGVVWTDNREGDMDIYYAPAGDAPFAPSTPDGPTSGKTGQAQTYSTSTTDPNGDDVSYGWDWNGDSVVDDWDGPYPSGQTASTSHTWDSEYTGEIKVKAKDTNDDESPWSNPLSVSIPKNKVISNSLFLKFLEEHPNMFPILRHLVHLLGL